MVMGVKAGLDPKVMVDVINAGSGRNSATQEKFPQRDPAAHLRFRLREGLMYKDVKLCLEEAAGARRADVGRERCAAAVAGGQRELGPESDFTRIMECLEGWAGVEVRGT